MIKKRILKLISSLLSPGIIWILGIFVFSSKEIQNLYLAIFQGLVILGISCMVPLIAIKMKNIPISALNTKNIIKHQNNPILILIILVILFLSCIITNIIQEGQSILIAYFAIVGTLNIIIYLLRFSFNCSGHVTAISALSCLLSLVYSISYLYFLPLIFLMAYSRVYLKFHSINEVTAGISLGVMITMAFQPIL
jgi:membrane-associated phospholipid phosphatase